MYVHLLAIYLADHERNVWESSDEKKHQIPLKMDQEYLQESEDYFHTTSSF